MAADAVLFVHLLYVLSVIAPVPLIVIGGKLGWRWIRSRSLRVLHLAMMGVVLAETIVGAVCPLTWLENTLRGTRGDGRGFVAHWVHRVMFYDAPPWAFGALYALFFGAIVGLWFLVPPNGPTQARAE